MQRFRPLPILLCAATLAGSSILGLAQQRPAAPPPPSVAPARPAAQQPPAATAQEDDEGQILDTLTVFLPVSVVDKQGKFVSNLTRGNFRIFEDGKEQRIESFEAPTRLPLHVAIMLDTSSSVKTKLKFEKDAAADFVFSILQGSIDEALFGTFDSNVEVHTDFTRNTGDLTRAIDKVKAGGDTRMFDAVYRVCEEKMAQLPPGGRPVIVVVTDGADTASERSLEEAIAIAQRTNVTVFGISTRNYSDINAGLVKGAVDKELQRLCEETGGRTFLPYERIELARAFKGINDNLRNQYVFYYTPDNQNRDNKFRKIKVEVSDADQKVSVQAKHGYYATPSTTDEVPR